MIRFLGWELRRGEAPRRPAVAALPAAALPPDLLDALAEGVAVLDARRRILFINDALSPLLNQPVRDAVGKPLWEVLRHRDVAELLEHGAESGEPQAREVVFPLPAETVWRVAVRPRADGFVLTFFDLTAVRRLENLRKEFVANVSHELKTPLTSLRAALETLLDGALEDPVHAREFLETAQTQVERLQRLIDDLLALSRFERPGAAASEGRADAAAAVTRVLAALRPLADKAGVALSADLPKDGPLFAALPEDELDRVLLNLLDNAVKFNRPGGRATARVRRLDGKIEVTVEDTGAGIAPEHHPRVFERFYRADKARGAGGTGLGLAIVKHIAEKRRGAITLASTPGQGTTFTLILPVPPSPVE